MFDFTFRRRFLAVIFLLACVGGWCHAQKKNAPVRESIEWLDVWMPNTNDYGSPRVLLIGNSITRGYYPEVQRLLNGTAYVARLSTSKSVGDPGLLEEIKLVMGYDNYDVIHFNNGMHGWGYTEDEYRKAFPEFVETIRKCAPKARLIWATTTPVRSGDNMEGIDDYKTDRIKERNRIAAEYMGKAKDIRTNDLFGMAFAHPEFYKGGDGVHPVESGYKALAAQVAETIKSALKK